jgi:hypothetical protein
VAIAGRIWFVSVLAAALFAAGLAAQMADDQHAGFAWRIELPLWLAKLVAFGLAMALFRVLPRPGRAFLVRRGRFVAPAAPWFRALVTAAALTTWGLIPLMIWNARVQHLGLSDRGVGIAVGVLALAVSIVAVRGWRYSVILTPEGVTVRAATSEPDKARWEEIRAGRVEGKPGVRGVEPEFIMGAIRHYRDRPEYRAAIGTRAEHDRLVAALS